MAGNRGAESSDSAQAFKAGPADNRRAFRKGAHCRPDVDLGDAASECGGLGQCFKIAFRNQCRTDFEKACREGSAEGDHLICQAKDTDDHFLSCGEKPGNNVRRPLQNDKGCLAIIFGDSDDR
jgi:hypothetical protein